MQYPLSKVTELLHLDSDEECAEYLEASGCTLKVGNENLDCKNSRENVRIYQPNEDSADDQGVTHGSFK